MLDEDARDTRDDDRRRFEVWYDNWPAWLLFSRVSTQWRSSAAGGVIGLDYEAVHGVMDAERVRSPRRRQELLRDVQMIEAGAIQALAEKAKR